MAQPFALAGSNVKSDYQEEEPTGKGVRDAESPSAEDGSLPSKKKPLSFYFTFLSLVIMVLLVSLDSTALGVAIPVSRLKICFFSLEEKTLTLSAGNHPRAWWYDFRSLLGKPLLYASGRRHPTPLH